MSGIASHGTSWMRSARFSARTRYAAATVANASTPGLGTRTTIDRRRQEFTCAKPPNESTVNRRTGCRCWMRQSAPPSTHAMAYLFLLDGFDPVLDGGARRRIAPVRRSLDVNGPPARARRQY